MSSCLCGPRHPSRGIRASCWHQGQPANACRCFCCDCCVFRAAVWLDCSPSPCSLPRFFFKATCYLSPLSKSWLQRRSETLGLSRETGQYCTLGIAISGDPDRLGKTQRSSLLASQPPPNSLGSACEKVREHSSKVDFVGWNLINIGTGHKGSFRNCLLASFKIFFFSVQVS